MACGIPIIDQAINHNEHSIALRADSGEHSYAELLNRSRTVASNLLDDAADLNEQRIAFLLPNGLEYIVVQWAIWQAGGVAVPLSLSAQPRELEYTIGDSQANVVITSESNTHALASIAKRQDVRIVTVESFDNNAIVRLPNIDPQRRAMILYTSGTTNKPKGVVSTHANIESQITTLVEAWEWQPDDCIPLFLPLHHIHGIINVLSCALWIGATIEAFPRFEIDSILKRVADHAFSVFMAVPTIYVKLIQKLESLIEDERLAITQGFRKMRLMVSGSAALPASVHQKWFELTGQKLLERYGMTEIGMAISNPFHGERRPGAVGQPLPRVDVRLKSENGKIVTSDNQPGEIQVRGPSVFLEYWHKPEITAESFDEGWFQTGDMAVYEDGYLRIMGRLSVDIIKSGGYKLSALEIESELLEHPFIRECAVVGIADETWGESVVAAVVAEEDGQLDLQTLRNWCKDRLSHYKIPKQLVVVENLPRNAMGKVTKPAVRDFFE